MPGFLSKLLSSTDEKDLIRKTWFGVVIIIAFGILLTLILSLYFPKNPGNNDFWQTLSAFGCGMLMGGAAFAAGGFGGFLFGIPSLSQNQDTGLKYNDNLIQISDWLTKIIVGVGLVELNRLPGKISQLGDLLKSNFNGGEWGKVASLSIVFYFFLFGFLIIYFWTRTDFTTILKRVDKGLQERLEDAQKEKKEIEKQKNKIENLLDSETARMNKEIIDQSEVAFDAATAESIDGEDPQMKQAVATLQLKVQDVLKTKKASPDPGDIQKGRWGGKSESNNKMINATVVPGKLSSFYDVTFTIIDKAQKLTTPVALFVHDSFGLPDNVIYLKPDAKGKAEVMLTAYEAFTVGALFPDGTELELDLNEQPGYPPGFYWTRNNLSSMA